ncbi:response regulator transcription factor [Adlercreutzia equolifaciens]|uniref:response regulator transcription factor n=1 Tax=Adlercreutzia TaxID=447020 RepID=UPI001D063EAA|nr:MULTISPECIES: response regulator transcription factor [Adlercreutzia]MCB6760915.1 response regulator transcription factor [Adlercreutzia equolifaciens]MCB6976646.1 response regulator transcription factor [Adlercreutzia equolifaciens]MDE8684809.1 response regulator transcription factor [Adlercreutzia rubneri]HJI11479.1 response regulator transcription factor [Adlercreutzia equolifaciens]
MKILIADDERDICEAVRKIVERAGHTCFAVLDGALAMEAFERERPDVVILDVMMPEVNGFELCRQLRERDARVPIIMLSAKSDIVDKGVGFAAGCDDYIAKPFNSQELAMRIEAQLRRARLATAGDEVPRRNRSVVRLGDMEVRLKRNEVLVHGRYVNLTPKEFQIIAFLANHAGEVFSAQDIMANVWGEAYRPDSASIAVFVRKIRSKIEDDPAKPRYLQTVWREGYRLGDESMIDEE